MSRSCRWISQNARRLILDGMTASIAVSTDDATTVYYVSQSPTSRGLWRVWTDTPDGSEPTYADVKASDSRYPWLWPALCGLNRGTQGELNPTMTTKGATYTVTPMRPGLDAKAVQVVNRTNGKIYRVAVDHDGRMHCNCPAYKYARRDQRTCKHIEMTKDTLR